MVSARKKKAEKGAANAARAYAHGTSNHLTPTRGVRSGTVEQRTKEKGAKSTRVVDDDDEDWEPNPLSPSLLPPNPDTTQAPRALPAHWKSQVDPNTKMMYYYHVITKETSWFYPTAAAGAGAGATISTATNAVPVPPTASATDKAAPAAAAANTNGASDDGVWSVTYNTSSNLLEGLNHLPLNGGGGGGGSAAAVETSSLRRAILGSDSRGGYKHCSTTPC